MTPGKAILVIIVLYGIIAKFVASSGDSKKTMESNGVCVKVLGHSGKISIGSSGQCSTDSDSSRMITVEMDELTVSYNTHTNSIY